MLDNNQPSNEDNVFEAIAKDPAVRRAVTRESHMMFFSIYLRHYIKHAMAAFQKEIIHTTEDQANPLACIVAFRGSAKSTLVTLSYALWAVLGVQQKKFVLIICQTQAQARQHMMNLRRELEHNLLLQSDLGPFRHEDGGEWAAASIVFQNTGARIMVASVDQSIRGVRHYEHRPDLIILDDIEDLRSTQTSDGRNKTFEWFTREIVPLGDMGTRIVLVGNLLHEDSLMMRLRRKIESRELKGTFQWFPLLAPDGHCLWPEKFDTPEKIEELRQSIGNELAWQQEYLLNIMSDSTRVIWPEWIQTYDALPTLASSRNTMAFMGMDLAISQREAADCTAVVSCVLYGRNEQRRIYVLPNIVNKRMTPDEGLHALKATVDCLPFGLHPKITMETNGFQELYFDQARQMSIRADFEGVKNMDDKRSRLSMTSHYIQSGKILFPKQGAEQLIAQLTGFGVEHHDDLADAFAMMILRVLKQWEANRGIDEWLKWCESNGGPWL